MIVRDQENVFVFAFGVIIPAALKCIICADVVYPPGEKLSLCTRFRSNQRFFMYVM